MFDRVGSGAKLVRATCVGQEGDAILVLLAEWKKSVGGARRCWFEFFVFLITSKIVGKRATGTAAADETERSVMMRRREW